MKVDLTSFMQAAKEGDITIDWFTRKQAMLEEMVELGFTAYYINQLRQELELIRAVVFPTENEKQASWTFPFRW